MKNYQLVIIGAGITGLSTAFEVKKQSKEKGRDISILIVDAGKNYLDQNPIIFDSVDQSKMNPTLSDHEQFFHPSSSFNAAGILATNGARKFRSELRKNLVGSIRSYPKWLEEINQLGTGSGMALKQIDDYHLFNLANPVEHTRYHSLLERLEFEAADDGIVEEFELGQEPNFIKNLFGENKDTQDTEDIENIKAVKFVNNHFIDSQQFLKHLIEVNEKLGIDFAWEYRVDHLQKTESPTSHFQLSLIHQTTQESSHITSQQVLLASGWNDQLLKNTTPKKIKTDPGLLRVYSASSSLAENIILRLGNKNYLVQRDGQAHYCQIEENDFWQKRINDLFKNQLLKENRFGLRALTSDKRPIFSVDENGFAISTAYHKIGIAMAPMMAKKMAEILLEDFF